MQKKILSILAILAILGCLVFLGLQRDRTLGQPTLPSNTYSNETYGLSFQYPKDGYVLTEGEQGDGMSRHYAIVITRAEDTVLPEAGEGPRAVTIAIHPRGSDVRTLEAWVKDTNVANFNISDGVIGETAVDGVPALMTYWSGLYEGSTTTFLHEDSAIAVSMMYDGFDDPIIALYDQVLFTFRFDKK